MRSRPRGSASTRSRKLPDQRKPSLRSKKENPPGPVETPATGPAAGPLPYPDAKIVTANGASRPSAPAINPDERSGLTDQVKDQIEAATKTLEFIDKIASTAARIPEQGTPLSSGRLIRAETGADFRALRDMLLALDPENEKN